MCKGKAKLAGVMRAKQAARAKTVLHIYGTQGLVRVEYTGSKEGQTSASVFTNIKYPYYPGRQFYVDANDASRVMSWRENGEYVFQQVNNANSS